MLEELAATQHGVLSRSQVRAAGISDSALNRSLQAGRLLRVHPGVFQVAGAPETWMQAVVAASLWGGEGTWLSHSTAAVLWELEGIYSPRVELSTVRNPRCRPSGLIVHRTRRMPACDVCSLNSLSLTNATRTLIDLVGSVRRSVLESALDQPLRKGLTSTWKLLERLEKAGGRGKTGTSLLRRLVEERSGVPVAESVLETKMLTLLRRAGLPPPHTQYVVREATRFVARLDFAYPERRLGIEVDGYRYHSDKRAWQRDLQRANALMRLGWRVPRFTWEQVTRQPHEVTSEVRLLWREMAGFRR